jgi:uncharacterized membrane protein
MVDSTPLGSDDLPPTGPEPTPDVPAEPTPLQPFQPVEPALPPEPEPAPLPPKPAPAPPPSEPAPAPWSPPPPPAVEPPGFSAGPSLPPGAPKVTGLEDNDRIMAALAYVLWFVGSAIILLSKDMKDRPYQRYHALQGLGLSVVVTVYSVVAVFIALAGTVIGICCCFWVLVVPGPAVAIYYAYRAYQGEYFTIPILTNLMITEGWLPKS